MDKHPILTPTSASLSEAIRLLGEREPGLVDNIKGRVGRSWLPIATIVAKLRALEPDLFNKIMDQVVVSITACSKDDPEFIEKYKDDIMVILNIPDSLTTIGDYAFHRCTGLTEVHFPSSLTTIGHGAFRGCTALTEVHFPTSLTTIGNSAFWGCTGLINIHFPHDSVLTTIGNNAFNGCTGLTEVQFPTSLTEIGYGTFEGCTGLTKLPFDITLEDALL